MYTTTDSSSKHRAMLSVLLEKQINKPRGNTHKKNKLRVDIGVRSKKGLTRLALTQFIGMLLTLSSFYASAELKTTVDRSRITIEETLNLTVRYTGNQNGQPDFSQLEKQFEIISRQQSNQFRSYNGKVTSFTEWNLVIAPREEGRLFIPSFKFDGKFSDAVPVTVTAAEATPAGSAKNVFLQTIIDKSTSYVQEQIKLTFRLHYAVNIDGLDAQPIELENVIIEQLPDVKYRKNIRGRFYNVAEFSYVLYPQNSGELIIPSLQWNAKISVGNRPRSLFNTGRYELKRLRTNSKVINVKPQPDGFPADATWLPAKSLRLTEAWSGDLTTLKAGEPVTRTLTLTANGLMSSQLPTIVNEESSDDLKFYADQAKKNDDKKSSGIVSNRIESAAVVFSKSGDITIPTIKIPWWDTEEDKLKYAEIAAQTIVVKGSQQNTNQSNLTNRPNVTSNESPVTPQFAIDEEVIESYHASLRIWKLLTGLFLLLWLIFIVLWWRARNITVTSESQVQTENTSSKEKNAYKAFKQACRTNNPHEARKQLLIWAQRYWQNPSIFTLRDISDRVDDDSVKNQLSILDACMYAQNESQTKSENWNGELLLSTISQWQKNAEKTTREQKNSLPSLYAS